VEGVWGDVLILLDLVSYSFLLFSQSASTLEIGLSSSRFELEVKEQISHIPLLLLCLSATKSSVLQSHPNPQSWFPYYWAGSSYPAMQYAHLPSLEVLLRCRSEMHCLFDWYLVAVGDGDDGYRLR
jgi:hypothetical protein